MLPAPEPPSMCVAPDRLAAVRFVRFATLPPPEPMLIAPSRTPPVKFTTLEPSPVLIVPVTEPACRFTALANAPRFTTPVITPLLLRVVGPLTDVIATSVAAPERFDTEPWLLIVAACGPEMRIPATPPTAPPLGVIVIVVGEAP